MMLHWFPENYIQNRFLKNQFAKFAQMTIDLLVGPLCFLCKSSENTDNFIHYLIINS